MLLSLIFVGLFSIFINSNVSADWLDNLALEIGSQKEWNQTQALEILEKNIKNDEAKIKEIEEKIDYLKKTEGFWATFHTGTYNMELATIKSQKIYHNKIVKALKALENNKKDQETIFESLKVIYKLNQELSVLNKDSESSNLMTTDMLKLKAKIVTKKAEIGAKKTYLKSVFLIS